MTGRRAIGTLLQRAARAELAASVGVCRSGCAAALNKDGPPSAVSGCSAPPEHQTGAKHAHASVQVLQPHIRALLFAPSCPLVLLSTTTTTTTTASTTAAAAAGAGPFSLHTRTYTSLASAAAPQPAAATAAASAPPHQPQPGLGDANTGSAADSEGGGGGGGLPPAYDPEVLALRGQLVDSLAVCLGLQQLDLLLARQENRDVFDETLLLTTLDTAYRLCTSATAAGAVPAATPLALAASATAAAPHKSSAEAASDVLTRLSEMLIRMLSEPGALSPDAAVRVLRTLAMLRFNPAGDYAGLQTMAAFYRETVVPALNPEQAAPDLAARAPQLLIDLFFAFTRLFDAAARRERELQAQLMLAQISEEEATARRADDEEAAAGSGSETEAGSRAGSAASEAAAAAPAPWQRPPTELGAAFGGPGMMVGDRQLYFHLSQLLAAPGMLSNVTSKSLGTLATAMATARFAHYPLTQSIATQTLLRLQNASTTAAAAAAAAGLRGDVAVPAGGDVMATSTLSNILSCLSKLGFEHEALCDAAANWMLQRLYGGGAVGAAAAAAPSLRGGGLGAGVIGGVEPHHIVDVAVAFTRLKYENTDYLTRASEVLQLKLPQSTPNSVAMMAWAVANSKSGRSPEFQPLFNALAQRMVALHRHTYQASRGASGIMQVVPRHLACILFAMARLGQLQPRLVDTVGMDVVERAERYQARQLVNVLRALTLVEVYRPDVFAAACAVLEERLRAYAGVPTAELAANPPAAPFVFAAQNYSDLAWAVALSGHAPQVPGLMELLVARFTDVASQLGRSCLVRAAQALAVAPTTPGAPQAFDALAEASRLKLVDLGPAYLAALVDSFAEAQHPVTEDFWLACMDAAGLKVPHMERPRPDMQLAASRLAAAFRRHPATQQFEACRKHYVLPLLYALVPEATPQPDQQQ